MTQRVSPISATIKIEYCTGCRWLLRSAWLAQEILSTFEKEGVQVLLSPSKEGGTFLISILETDTLLWDRRQDGGFPEAKEIKQRLRNALYPLKDLGHSGD